MEYEYAINIKQYLDNDGANISYGFKGCNFHKNTLNILKKKTG